MLFPSPGWGPSTKYIIPLRVLERFCTVVYFDTRHSGASTGPERADAYTLSHFVADIEGLRQHIGAIKIFVAGHSAGGHQALAYGIAHPEHLHGIIAIDAIAAPDELRARERVKAMNARRTHPYYIARPGFVDAAVAIMTGADATPRSTREVLQAIGPFYFHDPEVAEDFMATFEIDDAVAAYTNRAGFQGDNLLFELHRIDVPTLVIVGDDDFTCDPLSQASRIHALIPGSTLAIIGACGHVPWIEQPAQFDAACQNWLNSVVTASMQ
jgi:proline iminopeptidase